MREISQVTKEQIEKVIDISIKNKELVGVNLLVQQDGQEVHYYEAGMANVEKQTMIQRDSIFRLYSMSKPITAGAVMILMERGMIDLFDSVSSYIPEFRNQSVAQGDSISSTNRDVTIKDLLNMTSGIPYPSDSVAGQSVARVFEEIDNRLFSEDPMSTVEFADKMGDSMLDFQPGDSWNYGASADILGAVVEVVSGVTFGEFLSKEIFEPLGMKDTGFYVSDSKQDRLTTVYETINNSKPQDSDQLKVYDGHNLGIMNPMNQQPAFESGGAGLVGTIDDYAKFTQMLLNGGELGEVRILKEKTVSFMTSQELDAMQMVNYRNWHTLVGHSYGNLMRIVKQPSLVGCLSSYNEYGWDGWLGCYFANLPKEKLTILIMMQKKDAGTTSLTRKIRNIVLSDLL